jgi:HupE / UreJ protein
MDQLIFYFKIGWEHIISPDALDHQLFLLCLVIGYQLRDFKKLLWLATAFAIGHCISLVLATFKIIYLPSYWVEILIPATIALTALGNLLGFTRKTWWLASLFGLIHGLGFSNTLQQTLGSGHSFILSLLSFNLGLEAGQIILLGICLIALFLIEFIFSQKVNKFLIFMLSFASLLMALYMIYQRAFGG